jgi:hypothetical protein
MPPAIAESLGVLIPDANTEKLRKHFEDKVAELGLNGAIADIEATKDSWDAGGVMGVRFHLIACSARAISRTLTYPLPASHRRCTADQLTIFYHSLYPAHLQANNIMWNFYIGGGLDYAGLAETRHFRAGLFHGGEERLWHASRHAVVEGARII